VLFGLYPTVHEPTNTSNPISIPWSLGPLAIFLPRRLSSFVLGRRRWQAQETSGGGKRRRMGAKEVLGTARAWPCGGRLASLASQVRRRHGGNGGGRRRRAHADEGERGGGDGKGGLVVAAIASAARQVRRRQVPGGTEGRASSPKCRARSSSPPMPHSW
jgi:hypothetical protein